MTSNQIDQIDSVALNLSRNEGVIKTGETNGGILRKKSNPQNTSTNEILGSSNNEIKSKRPKSKEILAFNNCSL